ncbi:putative IDI-2 precursor [Rosellinia necatrix]|uniref:Putative IDI-2 n=1 Tax=Rosellinia necatrix TaxID=77044 RepID=A0A1S8A9B0_ROSNE|nr:putative IDI-2 precursor [Rosellinia necatrix]
MQFASLTHLLLALGAPAVLAASPDADGCGAGGLQVVANATALPAGVDPCKFRKCAEHPLGRGDPAALEKRKCWYESKSFGCSKGYCWKRCAPRDTGNWCWTAAEAGWGDWHTCKDDGDCAIGLACGQGDCKACGCSC